MDPKLLFDQYKRLNLFLNSTLCHSDGTGDLIMQDIGPKSSGRRSRGKVSYKDEESQSEEELDEQEDDGEFEFD